MKKYILLLSVLSFILLSLPIVNPYVSDRQNFTFTPDIAGYTSTGFIPSRTDGSYIRIEDPSVLFSPNHRGYAGYNISILGNATYNFSKVESIYNQFSVANIDGWDSSDKLDIKRLNLTFINASDPLAGNLTNLIFSGLIINTSDSLTKGNNYNRSLIGILGIAEADVITQKELGYYSIGYEGGINVGTDEAIYLNGTNTSPPLLIVQTSCLPPFSFYNNNNWYINKTCVITDENFTIYSNVTILDSGNLILNGTTIASFNNNGDRFVSMNGGKLRVDGQAKIYGKF